MRLHQTENYANGNNDTEYVLGRMPISI